MARQIHVKVVAVVDVGMRPEHRREAVASAAMHRTQKRALLDILAPPAALDRNLAAVGKVEL